MSAASVNGVTTQASMIKVTTEAHPHDLLLYCGPAMAPTKMNRGMAAIYVSGDAAET